MGVIHYGGEIRTKAKEIYNDKIRLGEIDNIFKKDG
jgi:hypothetical protein